MSQAFTAHLPADSESALLVQLLSEVVSYNEVTCEVIGSRWWHNHSYSTSTNTMVVDTTSSAESPPYLLYPLRYSQKRYSMPKPARLPQLRKPRSRNYAQLAKKPIIARTLIRTTWVAKSIAQRSQPWRAEKADRMLTQLR